MPPWLYLDIHQMYLSQNLYFIIIIFLHWNVSLKTDVAVMYSVMILYYPMLNHAFAVRIISLNFLWLMANSVTFIIRGFTYISCVIIWEDNYPKE